MRNVTSLRWLYGAVTVVGLGVSVERVQAQDEAPLPASPELPPDLQERERMPGPPAPGRSPEVDELLQKVRLTRADIERRKADKSERAFPATTEEPPDVTEMKKAERTLLPPGRSPELGELLDNIRKQPGGAEKLEKARKGGARIPPPGAGRATLEPRVERMPGPRMDGPVYSDSTGEQLPTLKATKAAPYQNVAGLGSLTVSDWYPYYTNKNTAWGPYTRTAMSNHWLVGNVDAKPYMIATVNVTNPGWYIINFVGTKGKATLRKHGPGSPVLTKWDSSTSTNPTESYPFVGNLAAGSHIFWWIPETNFVWVVEVTLAKL